MGALAQLVTVLALGLLAAVAWARVSPEEAARLDADLTPLGAERAGNADGTIPAWTGGISEPPANFTPGQQHVDPFPDDPVLLTITAANLSEHQDHLTPGQRALLERFPDTWRMLVYPTRRTAAYPEFVYEAARDNAVNAVFETSGKGSARGARVTSPFPIPGSGVEAVWNHLLRWRGVRFGGLQGRAAVTRNGRYQVVLQRHDVLLPYAALPGADVVEKFPDVQPPEGVDLPANYPSGSTTTLFRLRVPGTGHRRPAHRR